MRNDHVELAPVCLRIGARHLEFLRQLARERAAAEKRAVSVSDLVKAAIEGAYPLPNPMPCPVPQEP